MNMRAKSPGAEAHPITFISTLLIQENQAATAPMPMAVKLSASIRLLCILPLFEVEAYEREQEEYEREQEKLRQERYEALKKYVMGLSKKELQEQLLEALLRSDLDDYDEDDDWDW